MQCTYRSHFLRIQIALMYTFCIAVYICFQQGCTETHSSKENTTEHTIDASNLSDQDTQEHSVRTEPSPDSKHNLESSPKDTHTIQKCNGYKELCSRKYNDVVYPTTHNAMSSKEDKWGPPNQLKNVNSQLKDGIRGFMLDVHKAEGIAMLCHGPNSAFCRLGQRPLKDTLTDFRLFLKANPNEVLTLILENYVSPELLEAAFKESQTLALTTTHRLGTPWPTLAEMIRSGKKIVVLTDKEGGKRPWLLPLWKHAWETHYAAKSKEDFSCKKHRGEADNTLFIFNHFLTDPVAKEDLAREVNFNPYFLGRVQKCQTEHQRLPNFVTVDFYSVGDLFSVVHTLNKLP